MMNWNQLHTARRTGIERRSTASVSRTDYQQDFDRLIFSSAFRRLQNKTQVFPLPDTVFVHNRLTHSLEVSSVGRSLGTLIGQHLADKEKLDDRSLEFYTHDLKNVIAAACLCHDIGNPAFGHSGEDAISNFFKKNANDLRSHFNENQWSDLIHFEGNANAIRVLAQKQKGKVDGGFKLTHTTLASIAKYPCESIAINKEKLHTKKYGFFQSEKEVFNQIMTDVNVKKESDNPLVYLRHPFVFLVEAADDICYNIIDLEDAHRLKIIDYNSCADLLISLIKDLQDWDEDYFMAKWNRITDKNERIAYLRAVCINQLVTHCVRTFKENKAELLAGTLNRSLVKIATAHSKAWKEIQKFSVDKIYNHPSVIEIEMAGYNVLYELLEMMISGVLNNGEDYRSKSLYLLPEQYTPNKDSSPYEKVMLILDYVSGMTDNYAVAKYKKMKGITI